MLTVIPLAASTVLEPAACPLTVMFTVSPGFQRHRVTIRMVNVLPVSWVALTTTKLAGTQGPGG